MMIHIVCSEVNKLRCELKQYQKSSAHQVCMKILQPLAILCAICSGQNYIQCFDVHRHSGCSRDREESWDPRDQSDATCEMITHFLFMFDNYNISLALLFSELLCLNFISGSSGMGLLILNVQ
jgi:hypothetical protein